uniref:Bm12934 n=1 Tax=Brugia malayi TaxID=6279 RepID=A0A1I9GEJ4_BRUMA|nr:Bm12934 [Brugia malayi]
MHSWLLQRTNAAARYCYVSSFCSVNVARDCWVGILSIEMIPEGSTEMVLSPLLLAPAQQRRDMQYVDKGWERFYRSNVDELRQGNITVSLRETACK